MNMFNVCIVQTGEEICVAARTWDHAAEVFITFWITRTGSAPGEFHIGTGAPERDMGDLVVQDVAAGHVAGVMVRQPDGSMLFEPAIA